MLITACNNDAENHITTSAENKNPVAATTPTPAVKSLPKIIAFGDSLTAGYGLPIERSYPTLLQKRLDAEGYHYEVINAGVSGDTSAGGVRRIDWVLDGDVKIVILELGANDILRGQPIKEMKQNLSTIIERAQGKGAKVLLTGIIAPPQMGSDYAKDVNAAFPELAKKYNLTLMPFFLDGVAAKPELNQEDHVHPNQQGTEIVMNNLYKVLLPLLEKN